MTIGSDMKPTICQFYFLTAPNDLHATSKAFPADHFIGPGNVHFTSAGSAKLADQVAAEILKLLE